MQTEFAKKLILLCFLASSAFPPLRLSANPANNEAHIAGVWRGNSVCMVKGSPCRDEVNVYRISKVEGKPNSFLVTGSRVVDGKEIVMGTGEWKYDAQKHTLEWENPAGLFKLSVDGNKMEGTLTSRSTVYRKISLTKEK